MKKESEKSEQQKEAEVQGVMYYKIYEFLSDGLKEENHSAQLYFFIFVWRRIIFVASVMYLPDIPSVQILIYVMLSLLNCIYLVWT